ncbi:hypothetical protein HDU86_004927 [Geranomyces michiganensis]|nr:hypothetical protein HDU86_004927 [Geranomyces michiganensis]
MARYHIGVPPLIELLSRRKDQLATTTIFGRLFVAPAVVAAPAPGIAERSTETLTHNTVDALLNLIGLSTHYESAAQAYTVVHENVDTNGMGPHVTIMRFSRTFTIFASGFAAAAHGAVERLGGVDALISYLARWGGYPKEALRCVEILGTLETLDTRDIQEEQREQLVDCFARWLSDYKEAKLLGILPFLKKWMKEDWFDYLFIERHGFFPMQRLLSPPAIPGVRPLSDKVRAGILEVCQMCLHGDTRKRDFTTNGGIGMLIHVLHNRPTEDIALAGLGVLSRLTSSGDAVDAFVSKDGLMCLANLLQSRKKFSTKVYVPLIKAIRRVATASSKGIAPSLRNRLVASLKAVKSETVNLTEPSGKDVMLGESIAMEVDKALSSLKGLADRTEMVSSDGAKRATAGAVGYDDAFGDDQIIEAPPPIINFDVNTTITDASISAMIPLLYAREFHVRAEAANIVRRVTTAKEFAPSTIQQLTLALMTLLDDDDHIAVQAAGALANLAAVDSYVHFAYFSSYAPEV